MLSFLYEQYGYYPIDVINNSFEIGEWKFKLEEVTCDENFLVELDGYLEKIRNSFNGSGAFIIKTRFGNSISIYDGKKYVLISVQNKKMSMQDLNKMHAIFVDGSRKVNLNNVLKVWQERMSFVENEAIKLLRTDSVYYKTNVEVAMFCLGLTQNAIQYLSETIADYGDTILPLTLTHKRLKDLNSFDFFNPFNLIVDHPIKDLCELYKSGFISFADFCEVVKYYNMDNALEEALNIANQLIQGQK